MDGSGQGAGGCRGVDCSVPGVGGCKGILPMPAPVQPRRGRPCSFLLVVL